MTTQTLAFKSLPQIAVSEGAPSPNPGLSGVWAWSTTLTAPVYWTGSLWTVGSTGGAAPASSSGTITLDFGSGSNEASIALTGQSAILSTATIALSVSSDATSTSHTAADHKYFLEFCSLTNSAPVAGTGFTIYARSIHNLTGTWTIQYRWSN
jgi:hypothetical protein